MQVSGIRKMNKIKHQTFFMRISSKIMIENDRFRIIFPKNGGSG